MADRLKTLVAWTVLAPVLLVGGLGTGLHGLLGCDHGGRSACCGEREASLETPECHDCRFCSRRASRPIEPANGAAAIAARDASTFSTEAFSAAGCDGCAVCDLLAQFHSVTPFSLDAFSVELASGEATLRQKNAVVAAATRLALSRGPPVV